MSGFLANSIRSSVSFPQTLKGSHSLFSSSPLIKGMTLCCISGQSERRLPAPETAWYVVTNTSSNPNSLSGVKAGTKLWIEQFGLTTMKPRFVPRRFLCALMSCVWSGLISGMISGTSGVQRIAELFDMTGISAFAMASSNWISASFSISTALKTKSTESFRSAISSVPCTIYFLTPSGIGSSCRHPSPTASEYALPFERGDAIKCVISNHG